MTRRSDVVNRLERGIAYQNRTSEIKPRLFAYCDPFSLQRVIRLARRIRIE